MNSETSCALCAQINPVWPLIESDEVPFPGLDGYRICDQCRTLKQSMRQGNKRAGQQLTSRVIAWQAPVHAYMMDRFAYILPESVQSIRAVQPGQFDAARQEQSAEYQRFAMIQTMLTSTHGFDGYDVASYLGFISAETVTGMGMFSGMSASMSSLTGAESDRFTGKLQEAKTTVITRLCQQAFALGGNAIIGLDLDYTMFTPSLLGVIVSGTAVVITPVAGATRSAD